MIHVVHHPNLTSIPCVKPSTEVPRAVVERILAGEANQLSLNSDEIPVTIPDVILEACEQQLRRGRLLEQLVLLSLESVPIFSEFPPLFVCPRQN